MKPKSLFAGVCLSMVAILLMGSGGIQSAYNLAEANGTPTAKRQTLNFIDGTGTTAVVADSGGVTTVTFNTSGSSGGGGLTVFSGSAVALTATVFAPIGGGAIPSTTEANVQVKSPAAATVANLAVSLSAAPGTGNALAITWRKASASQTLTCTITDPAVSCVDNTHTFTVAQGDLLDITLVPSGTIVATPVIVIATQFGTLASPNVQKAITSFTAQTSITIDITGLGNTNATVQCKNAASPAVQVIPAGVEYTNSTTITVTFSSSQSGVCIAVG